MKYDAILFDLDGTLVDSAPDLIQTLNDMLTQYQRQQADIKDVRPLVSYGSTKLLKVGFQDDYPIAFEDLREDFLTQYKKQNTVHTDFFQGVPLLLAAIEQTDTPWGIITNKPTDCTTGIAKKLALDKRAAAIVCGDTLPVNKPDPSTILLACRMIGVDPKKCIYIGDCERDIEAGQLAGMETIACNYGYVNPECPVSEWGATFVAQTPDDILPFIA